MNNGNKNICKDCALRNNCPALKNLMGDLNGVLNLVVRANGKGKRISIESSITVAECKEFSHIFKISPVIPSG